MRHFAYRVRWWWWLLTGPNVILLAMRGVDRHSIDIIMERWDAREPKA